jgi:hypothetical protein
MQKYSFQKRIQFFFRKVLLFLQRKFQKREKNEAGTAAKPEKCWEKRS